MRRRLRGSGQQAAPAALVALVHLRPAAPRRCQPHHDDDEGRVVACAERDLDLGGVVGVAHHVGVRRTNLPPAASIIHAWVVSSRRRRSTTSASAPANMPTSTTGRYVADWTSNTISGESVSEAMNQAAPTFCIHVPMFDAGAAIHRSRNGRSRRDGAGPALHRPYRLASPTDRLGPAATRARHPRMALSTLRTPHAGGDEDDGA